MHSTWVTSLVAWPAVIKFLGDDELTFVESSEALNKHSELLDIQLNPGDVLIDGAGQVYRLEKRLGRIEISQDSVETLTLDSVADLVRRHASNCGQCCVSKIFAPTISKAITLIQDMNSR